MTDGGSSIAAVQALLRVLAAGRDVAEFGTAFGEGAAAIARKRLAGLENVEALEGDAYELLHGRGPFGLVFADGGAYDWERIIELLEPGGLLVKDDLTPGRTVEGDPVREFLLQDPRLAAVEILTTPETAAIVASRRTPAPRRTTRAERS